MDTDGQVYLGAWTNWSHGSVMGATLTLTREQGNLLIAFTALFIPFVASRFWRVFAIMFHQCYSQSAPRDAIYHQRQVVLRNSSSPESGLISFIRLLWAWRSTTGPSRPWLRVLPVVLFSFFSICAFTVAGGFSSMISTAGEVLLKGDRCEVATTLSGGGNITQQAVARSFFASYMNDVANYAQQCYSNQNSGILECSRFITNAISTAVTDQHAACPFRSDICRHNNSNLLLDTGHLNSNDIFGINDPKDETLTLRFVLQVSPPHLPDQYPPSLESNISNLITHDAT